MTTPVALNAKSIRDFFEAQSNMKTLAYMAKDAVAKHHIDPKCWSAAVLRDGFVIGLEIEDDTIHIEVEHFASGERSNETIDIPVDVAAECGFDDAKWNAWADERLQAEKQALEESQRRQSEEAAAQKRERDIAQLRQLRAQYPDVK